MKTTRILPSTPSDNPPITNARKVEWLINDNWEHKGWLMPTSDLFKQNEYPTGHLLFVGGIHHNKREYVPENLNTYLFPHVNPDQLLYGESLLCTSYTRYTVETRKGYKWDIMAATKEDYEEYILKYT